LKVSMQIESRPMPHLHFCEQDVTRSFYSVVINLLIGFPPRIFTKILNGCNPTIRVLGETESKGDKFVSVCLYEEKCNLLCCF